MEPTLTATVRVAGVRSGHAREPTGAAAAAPPDQREDDRQPAGDRARGVGAHDLPRRRGAVGRGRAHLRRGGSGRRRPARRRLSHPPHRAHRRGGRGAGPVRASGRGVRARASGPCWPPPSSRSTPRCRPSCAAAPCACGSASTSTRPAGSRARNRSPTSRRSAGRCGRSSGSEIRYRKRDGEVKRLLDPLGLVLKAGVWYLVALSGRTRSLRTFRVSRVQSVRVLDDEVHAARRLRPRHALGRGVGRLPRELADQPGARAHASGAARPPPAPAGPAPGRGRSGDGVRTRRRRVGHGSPCSSSTSSQPRYDLMRFGGDLEVLEPLELRDQLAARAAADGRAVRLRASLTGCPSPTPSSASTAVGTCHRMPFEPPELGWQVDDVVTYRCSDCADMWYLEVSEDDLVEDDAPDWF